MQLDSDYELDRRGLLRDGATPAQLSELDRRVYEDSALVAESLRVSESFRLPEPDVQKLSPRLQHRVKNERWTERRRTYLTEKGAPLDC